MDDPLHLAEGSQHNCGNELAGQLAKEAASGSEAEIAYNKIPKSAVLENCRMKVNKRGKVNGTPHPRAQLQDNFFLL